MSRTNRPFWSAVIAVLVCPGTVGLLIPWLLRPSDVHIHLVGVPIVIVGIGLLSWCIRDFYVAGRGTLAPWAPPERLVIIGLYRVSRNPMYVAVLTILCGWAATFASQTMWIYATFMAVTFHLRVILGEEPWLAQTHGAQWTAYRARVPRWVGVASLHPPDDSRPAD